MITLQGDLVVAFLAPVHVLTHERPSYEDGPATCPYCGWAVKIDIPTRTWSCRNDDCLLA